MDDDAALRIVSADDPFGKPIDADVREKVTYGKKVMPLQVREAQSFSIAIAAPSQKATDACNRVASRRL